MTVELQNGLPDSKGIMYTGPSKEQEWLVKLQDGDVRWEVHRETKVVKIQQLNGM